jgi:PAS domain S-box-containing protein
MAKINNSINDHVPLENEYRVIRADGKERWIGVWGNSFYDEGGRPQRMSGICIDITERKHADSILHATSQYLENLINYANAPIVVWDPEFRITRFNYAFELLTGRDAKDVIGRHLELLFPEKYRETSMNLIRRTILGERLNVVEIPILRMDGEIRIVLWNSATLYEPDKTTIHSTIAQGQDITERKFAEENGRKTLSLLNAALESTADGILVVDLNGKITSYNQNFATMWNISEKLLNSSEDGTVLGPGLSQIKDPDGYLARIKELYAHPAGESYDMIEFSDGRIFERYSKPQKIGDTIIGRVWSFRDISDRRHAEEALRQSEEKFRIIATNTPDHILVQDRDLRYIQVINPQLGLNEGDMTGKTDHDILSKEDAEKLTEVKKRVLDTGKPLFLELPLVTRAGDINYFEGSFIPKLNKAGQVDGIIGYFRNVTERKLAEEKIISALREKETLIREVHHRVKNNLQVISGLLDMTRMRTSDESTGSILTDMMMKIQTMAQIHTRLYESKQFDRINMEGQIRDQIAAMTNIYSVKDRQIAYEINSDEIYLPVDQAIPCALVVNEILSNIFKHAFKGRRRGNIDITMMQDDGNVRLIIRDDGIGMPEGFDISRTNSLGIKLIRTLTQHQLNGSLMVSSQHGTEVIVEFPIRKTET